MIKYILFRKYRYFYILPPLCIIALLYSLKKYPNGIEVFSVEVRRLKITEGPFWKKISRPSVNTPRMGHRFVSKMAIAGALAEICLGTFSLSIYPPFGKSHLSRTAPARTAQSWYRGASSFLGFSFRSGLNDVRVPLHRTYAPDVIHWA